MTWPTDQGATADLISAAQFNRLCMMLADTTLGASAASIDLTSIPAHWTNLRLSVYARSDRVAVNDQVKLRFNNDSAGNYYDQNVQGSGATASAGENLGATSAFCGQMTGANAADADDFGGAFIFIPHYAGTKRHPFVATSFSSGGTGAGSGTAAVMAGVWKSAAAINRITLIGATGANFVAGTRVTLEGMGRI